MAIGDDFSVNAAGDIRHDSGSTNYTVLELHRWLMDLADDQQASGNDIMDITVATPSDRSTDNVLTLNSPFNIDDTASQFLYNGSITQDNGDTIYASIVIVGAVESGTQIQAIQDNAIFTSFWSTGINADATKNILSRMLIKVRENGADIDERRLIFHARELSDTWSEFVINGTALGNNTAAIFTANDLNNQTAGATIDTWDQFAAAEGLALIDVNNDGTDEEYYVEWSYDNGATPTSPTANDLYEYTKREAERGSANTLFGMNSELFRGVTTNFAYSSQSGTWTQNETVVWGTDITYDNLAGGTFAVGDYVTIGNNGAAGRVMYDNGSTNMIVALEDTSITINDGEQIAELPSGATADVDTTILDNGDPGGSAVILADDDDGATGNLYVQIVTGSAPVNTAPLRGLTSGATAIAGTPTARTISPEFIGLSTGSALIGAYGVGIQFTDLTKDDRPTDLSGTTNTPPNNVTFTVFGLVSGEDRVLVTPDNSGVPLFAQMSLSTTLNGAAETAVVVDAIPADTPAPTGTIRIELDTAISRYQAYTAVDFGTDTFTIASSDYTDPADATSTNDVMVSYIDKLATATSEAFTTVYNSDRTLFVRVRDGGTAGDGIGIKTFETTATLGTNGGSATAVRTPDA